MSNSFHLVSQSPCLSITNLLCLDIQNCEMKFGSWTYSGEQVDLVHINQTNGSSPYYGNNSNKI